MSRLTIWQSSHQLGLWACEPPHCIFFFPQRDGVSDDVVRDSVRAKHDLRMVAESHSLEDLAAAVVAMSTSA